MMIFSGPESRPPWAVGRAAEGHGRFAWEQVDVVAVCGNSLLLPVVFSVPSLAENEGGGSGGSGDLS